jgi:hypothetical protein
MARYRLCRADCRGLGGHPVKDVIMQRFISLATIAATAAAAGAGDIYVDAKDDPRRATTGAR